MAFYLLIPCWVKQSQPRTDIGGINYSRHPRKKLETGYSLIPPMLHYLSYMIPGSWWGVPTRLCWYTLRQEKGHVAGCAGQTGSGVWGRGWITGELVHGSEWITLHGSPNPIIPLLLQRGLKFMSAHAASSLGGRCHSSSGYGRTGQAAPGGPSPV